MMTLPMTMIDALQRSDQITVGREFWRVARFKRFATCFNPLPPGTGGKNYAEAEFLHILRGKLHILASFATCSNPRSLAGTFELPLANCQAWEHLGEWHSKELERPWRSRRQRFYRVRKGSRKFTRSRKIIQDFRTVIFRGLVNICSLNS